MHIPIVVGECGSLLNSQVSACAAVLGTDRVTRPRCPSDLEHAAVTVDLPPRDARLGLLPALSRTREADRALHVGLNSHREHAPGSSPCATIPIASDVGVITGGIGVWAGGQAGPRAARALPASRVAG